MPTIKRIITAATDDALQGLKFKVQGSPALITLAASSATAGEDLSFSVGSQEFCSACEVNLEVANQVIDMQRDIILQQEAVPAGEYYLRVPTVAADLSFCLIIEPVPV